MMKVRGLMVGLVAAGWLLTAPVALGAEEKEASKSIDERVSDLETSLGALKDFGLSGMAYGSWLYNFNDPDSRTNSIRSFDQDHNSLSLDLFQLGIAKTGPAGLAFASKLNFGKTAGRMGSDWKGDGQFDGITNSGGDIELEEAYVTYTPEWAGGGSVKFGKFVTLLGAEVIEAPLNMNYSRSFLFGFAIPFTHTGVLFTAPLTEQLAVNIGAVNGWDNVADNNNGKTLLGNIAFTASPEFLVILNGTYGPEQNNTSDNSRGVVDLVSTITLDPMTISLNFDYGTEDEAALDGGKQEWYGFAGVVGVKLEDMTGLPMGAYLRGEIFKDDGGGRTGTDQQLWEITLTGKYFVTEKLTLWLEFRHDGSDEDSFAEEGSLTVTDPLTGEVTTTPFFKDTQDTFTIAASYVF